MMSSTTDQSPTMLYSLQVFCPDGAVFRQELKPGQVLIAGSSAACGLRLDNRDVAGMHCSMEPDDIGIKLRDWSSDGGTFVDNGRVDEEMYVQPGAEIRIADFRIVVHGTALSSFRNTNAAAIESVPAAIKQSASEELTFHQPKEHDVEPAPPVGAKTTCDPSPEVASNTPEPEYEQMEPSTPAWNRDFDPWDIPDESDPFDVADVAETRSPAASPPAYDRDAFCDDTSDRLQAELDFLRTELAERDARLSELENISPSSFDVDAQVDTISTEEAETLVSRLEQLLAELDEKDEQIATLSDLLRTSEDAVEAADEERQQMETWIGEVERRVGQWQEEWHAERDRMQLSIEELTEQRDQAEQRLTSEGAAGAANPSRDRFLQQLREEYSLLKEKHLQLEQDRDLLQSQLAQAGAADIEQRVTAAVDEALRVERLELAQEKATIARLKSEVAKQQEELESRSLRRGDDQADSADLRIRAFREHLREIHETDPRPVQAPTFSDRMGKLWRKLEGRPLDTD